MNEYQTIKKEAQDEVVIKKSRFIAYAKPVQTPQEAMDFVGKIKKMNHNATHNCFAYVLKENSNKRCSDDGEPQGTAGVPMLDMITKEGLEDCVVVVTRYFGGVLLGTGGLVRAYTDAAKLGLLAAEKVTMCSVIQLQFLVEYSLYERSVLLIEQMGGKLQEPEFTDNVLLKWEMKEGSEVQLLQELSTLTRGSAKVEISQPHYAPF